MKMRAILSPEWLTQKHLIGKDILMIRQGELQIYGSQLWEDQKTGEYYVAPLIDPDNVDKRRAEVGLGKLSDYIVSARKLPIFHVKVKRMYWKLS